MSHKKGLIELSLDVDNFPELQLYLHESRNEKFCLCHISGRTTKYGGQCARLEIEGSLVRTLQEVLRAVSLGKTHILTAQYWFKPEKDLSMVVKHQLKQNTKKS